MPSNRGSVFALSIHADYRCRHSGVCCSSDWDVPVELPVYRGLAEALAGRRLRPFAAAADAGPALVVDDDLPEDAAAMLARTSEGDCVFLDTHSHRCVVHRDLGEGALPATCRHFPRLAVRDRRGTFISLSHYCPTAAATLFREDVALTIVESPAAFPPGDYDGLDVDLEAWPPLLHPTMLMAFEDYGAWERHMVERCSRRDLVPERVVATIERDARLLRRHVPGEASIEAQVGLLPPEYVQATPPPTLAASLAHHARVIAAVPDELRPKADEAGLEDAYETCVAPAWPSWSAPVNRFLAAKAFANWTAYQGRGLLSIVRGLDAALALVRVEAARGCRDRGGALDGEILLEAFRRADFALNHLAVGEELADVWSTAEREPDPSAAVG